MEQQKCPKCGNLMEIMPCNREDFSGVSGDTLQGGFDVFCPICEEKQKDCFRRAVQQVKENQNQEVSLEVVVISQDGNGVGSVSALKAVKGTWQEIMNYLDKADSSGGVVSLYKEVRGFPPIMGRDYIESYEERITAIKCGGKYLYALADYNV